MDVCGETDGNTFYMKIGLSMMGRDMSDVPFDRLRDVVDEFATRNNIDRREAEVAEVELNDVRDRSAEFVIKLPVSEISPSQLTQLRDMIFEREGQLNGEVTKVTMIDESRVRALPVSFTFS
jgi:hypothetical protein